MLDYVPNLEPGSMVSECHSSTVEWEPSSQGFKVILCYYKSERPSGLYDIWSQQILKGPTPYSCCHDTEY